jgi:hypothetical protein
VKKPFDFRRVSVLLAGDILVLILVTVFGFASHGTLATAGSRLLTTFIPLGLAWFAVAPFLGCYDLTKVSEARQLWRPFWAMVIAGPLAAFLRSVMLGNVPVLPLFVLIISGTSALSILAWRLIYPVLTRRSNDSLG